MDRDEAAMLLVVLVSGALLWLVGGLAPSSPTEDERAAWQRIWLPAIPASIPLFVLVGFAVAAPEGPQSLHVSRLLAIVPFGVVWTRAAVRAARAVFRKGRGPALTEGLLRPRVKLSSELRALLDPGELRAVIAHENAHVRHRDPLRLWLVQLLTDLQWPFRRPRLRQRVWRHALELARDEEAARPPDVDAADLASALLKTASLVQPPTAAGAALADDTTLLETRVRRLLVLEASTPEDRPRSLAGPVTVGLAIASFAFGVAASAPFVAILAGSP